MGKRTWGARFRVLGAAVVAVLGVVPGGSAAGGYEAGERAFEAGNRAKAAAVWRPLARVGSARAQHALGVLYDRGGDAVAAEPSKAATWYRRAAAQGHRDARTNLGRLYATGRGVTEDPATAAELWRRAARHGHAVAQYNLALAYHQGRGVAADPRGAARWLRRAASQGLPQAQHALARMYRLGRALPRDPGLALAWYARAAENGHPGAKRRARALRDQGVTAAEGAGDPGHGAAVGENTMGDARYVVWLGTAASRDAARRRWSDLRRRSPAILKRMRLRLRTVESGADEPVTRLLGGSFPQREVASELCADLHARDRGAFCQVLASPP